MAMGKLCQGMVVLACGVCLASGLRAEEAPIDRGIGRAVPDFTLKHAVSGDPVRLYGFRGKKAAVIAFLGVDCPNASLYAPRLAELYRTYQDRGVVFLAVYSNQGETAAQIAAHAREHGIDFPVLRDQNNLVADLLLVDRTCDVLVLDGRAVLRYRGAIDNQYGLGTRKDQPERQYLRDALDRVSAGKPVEVPATRPVGCLIDRIEVAPKLVSGPKVRFGAPPGPEEGKPEAVGPVTYAADIAPIVQNKCQSCHRPGEPGPFSLLSYDDVRRHAAMIGEVVADRRMPPWHADPRYGHFANDRGLTAQQRARIVAWVEQGAPLGDPKDLPTPRTFPEGWTIGTPDVVFELPEPYNVAAQGTLAYVYTRVPTHFKEDVWVQAAEARPGDRAVVHHILVYVDGHQKKRREEGHFCGYAPGDMPSVYPPGVAKRIPAGSDLIFQVHYTPNGKRHTDRSKVGLIFAKTPVTREAQTHGIAQPRFLIPAGQDDVSVFSSMTIPRDVHLLSFMPHMHLRGKSFTYRATFPDGKKETLLSVPAFDFGWQSYYVLAEPRALPKGTKIDCEAHYDNSANNPYNPDPKAAVTWGDQTFQEMMIGYIDYTDDEPIPKK